MKKLLLVMAIATVSASSFAQEKEEKKVIFSVGAEVAAPVGELSKGWNAGIGGTAQGEYKATDKVGLTLNAGYISYIGKKISEFRVPAVSQIPILAGARYYFIKDIYVSGQLGMSIFKAKDVDSESAFTFAPGIGAKFSVLDATLKYMGATTKDAMTSNVSLRVAITF